MRRLRIRKQSTPPVSSTPPQTVKQVASTPTVADLIKAPRLLRVGSVIERVLSLIGITDNRVSNWLGKPCGCRRRREKLDRLSDIAYSYLRGQIDATQARVEFDKIVGWVEPSIPEGEPKQESTT